MNFNKTMKSAALCVLGLVAPLGAAAASPISNPVTESGGGAYRAPTDASSVVQRAALLMQIELAALQFGVTPKRIAADFSDANSVAKAAALAAGTTRYQWPLQPAASNGNDYQAGVSNYVDLNANFPDELQDYACGTRTYDTTSGYNHQGIDIASWPYPWTTMDADGLDIVAAAPGTILLKSDNNPDRSCALNSNSTWNAIVVGHEDGTRALYGHMKIGSLTSKAVGGKVNVGEYLGQVGSSGNSTGPHLHFELLDEQNNPIDTFAGVCGNADSRWHWQPPYNKTRINALLTGNAAPVTSNCYDGSENSNYSQAFSPGETIYITAFFTNQHQGQSARLQVYQPDGSLWLDAPFGPASSEFSFSYFWRSFTAPNLVGRWRAVVSVEGNVSETEYFVSVPVAKQGALVTAVLPGSRSIQVGSSASFFATLLNAGAEDLTGCRILPVAPLDVDFSFSMTDPATNAVIGAPNISADIDVGASQSFVVALTPNSAALPLDLRFAYKCNNAPAAAVVPGLNTLLLSASELATADILPIAVTASGDGVVRLLGSSGIAAFATAAVNIGALATAVEVAPVLPGATASLSLCETDVAGQCLAPPAASVSVDFAATPHTFTVFVQGTGVTIPLDPANARVALQFIHDGVVRGVTSVAVTTE